VTYHAEVSDAPVRLSPGGPTETVLPDDPPSVRDALEAALGALEADRRAEVARVVAAAPRSSAAWAALGGLARDDVEAYACYRVGYHRGLDLMRASGWRGTGYLRAVHPSNRGVLDSISGLADCAARLGEDDEAERCRHFLVQLDPETYRL
jgi:hypothetical protein